MGNPFRETGWCFLFSALLVKGKKVFITIIITVQTYKKNKRLQIL